MLRSFARVLTGTLWLGLIGGLVLPSNSQADVPAKALKQLKDAVKLIVHVKISKNSFMEAPESDGTWGDCMLEGKAVEYKRNNLKLKKWAWLKFSLPCLRSLPVEKRRKKGKSLPPAGPMSWRSNTTIKPGHVVAVQLNPSKKKGVYIALLGIGKVVGGKPEESKPEARKPAARKAAPKAAPRKAPAKPRSR